MPGRKAPQPLRSHAFPDGLRDLSGVSFKRVSVANSLYQLTASVIQFAFEHGLLWVCENPNRSLFWVTSPMKVLRAPPRVETRAHHCMFGVSVASTPCLLMAFLSCRRLVSSAMAITTTFHGVCCLTAVSQPMRKWLIPPCSVVLWPVPSVSNSSFSVPVVPCSHCSCQTFLFTKLPRSLCPNNLASACRLLCQSSPAKSASVGILLSCRRSHH